ncbi:hypothetical protein [Methanosphaerula palustris]|uniref:Uncharacterized protein n=1 Tax=Methanosphaerula palustris (strain ATCC BAA-1556 / DSM 19958 / E1-9c) TaxID=521011 RepID=B8GKR1_METPE|nr:hypothetical protein [Methanosphaerula palustris]ACL17207.1 hypothetical protein Mpal_1902 [Methanosphaerula palustris E1-9c]
MVQSIFNRNLHYLLLSGRRGRIFVAANRWKTALWFSGKRDEKENESFQYAELITMRINAVDLLEHLKCYKDGRATHTIVENEFHPDYTWKTSGTVCAGSVDTFILAGRYS